MEKNNNDIQWKRWFPCDKLETNYYIDFVRVKTPSFTAQLSSSEKTEQRVLISSNSLIQYCRIDEIYTMQYFNGYSDEYEEFCSHAFFQLYNAHLYYSPDQDKELQNFHYQHFVISLSEEILHLIVKDEPLVTITKEAKK